MNAKEIVDLIKQSNPKLFDKIPDAKAERIITKAFREVGKMLNSAEEGLVKVNGLGAFQVREVMREKDNDVIIVKKIMFRAAKAKTETESAE